MPTTNSSYKRIVALLKANAGAQRLSTVFDHFIEMSAISFRNSVDRGGHARREARYLEIAGTYDRVQLERFAHALALVVDRMEKEPEDVLGHLYMDLGLGNSHMGQFFTPFDVAKLVASISVEDLIAKIKADGYATVHEPACGAAAFMIALCLELKSAGINYQKALRISAEDLSIQAVHMAYIHLTLMHVPAVIHHRDTLTQVTHDSWRTPARFLAP